MSLASGPHPDWTAFHVFYHGDRSTMVREMLRPLVEDLARRGSVERFFFIRYPLGGPHLRLRFSPRRESGGPSSSDRQAELAAMVEQAAKQFFRDHPSDKPVDEEEIRRDNEIIVRIDPAESQLEIFPDCSCIPFDFEPETERYGGPDALEPSLDFFCVSSRRALDFANSHGERSRSRQLPAIFCILAQQAWGFARGEDELLDLLAYPMSVLRSEPDHPLLLRGEEVFEAQADQFTELLARELAPLCEAEPAIGESDPAADPGRALVDGSRWLSAAVTAVAPDQRRVIGSSQMHMTANRLGLTNPEELYLSRLMQLAAQRLARTRPADWKRFLARLERPLPSEPGAARAAEKLSNLAMLSTPVPTPVPTDLALP